MVYMFFVFYPAIAMPQLNNYNLESESPTDHLKVYLPWQLVNRNFNTMHVCTNNNKEQYFTSNSKL